MMRVEELMSRLGFKTKQAFAESLGVSHGLVSQWASGTTFPSYSVSKKILELGGTTWELFGIDCRKTCPYSKESVSPEYSRIVEHMANQEVARTKIKELLATKELHELLRSLVRQELMGSSGEINDKENQQGNS